jgi:hypothetical protein
MAQREIKRVRRAELKVGERIWLEEGPGGQGEWEVMAIEDERITLRCPIAHRLHFIQPVYEISAERSGE